MKPKFSKELTLHRLEQAKEDYIACKMLFEGGLYKPANNRAYYSIFHSIRCVLSLEPVDFKRHKDVVAYFNKNYVNTEIFPKTIGRRISKANQIREDSDYDDKFEADRIQTELQLKTAEELLQLVQNYILQKLDNDNK